MADELTTIEYTKEEHDRIVRLEERQEALKCKVNRTNEQTFVPRAEYELQHNKVCEDVKSLRESRAEMQGKANQSTVDSLTWVTVITLVIAVISMIVSYLR